MDTSLIAFIDTNVRGNVLKRLEAKHYNRLALASLLGSWEQFSSPRMRERKNEKARSYALRKVLTPQHNIANVAP